MANRDKEVKVSHIAISESGEKTIQSDIISQAKLAQLLEVSDSQIRKIRRERWFPSYKFGRSWYFRLSEVEEILFSAKNRRESEAEFLKRVDRKLVNIR